jgi:hypothetical protein
MQYRHHDAPAEAQCRHRLPCAPLLRHGERPIGIGIEASIMTRRHRMPVRWRQRLTSRMLTRPAFHSASEVRRHQDTFFPGSPSRDRAFRTRPRCEGAARILFNGGCKERDGDIRQAVRTALIALAQSSASRLARPSVIRVVTDRAPASRRRGLPASRSGVRGAEGGHGRRSMPPEGKPCCASKTLPHASELSHVSPYAASLSCRDCCRSTKDSSSI